MLYPQSLELMVGAMNAHPDAALGLSHSKPEEEQPYPWLLSPAEAWRKQFLGDGCMGCGPSGAIIRRDRFFEAGGFRTIGVVSDTDMWFRMTARWPMVLLPPAMVWWRRHEGQEFSTGNAELDYLSRGHAITIEALESPDAPLTSEERASAIARARQHQARKLLSLGLKRGQVQSSIELMRKSGLGVSDLLNGFRKYQ